MQLKESGTPRTTGNPNASSNIWNPRRGNTVLHPLTWSDLCSLAVYQTNGISAQSAKHYWGRLTSSIDSIPIIFCFVSVQLYNYSWIQNKVRTKHFLESISRHYRVFSMSLNENNNNKKNFETIKRKKQENEMFQKTHKCATYPSLTSTVRRTVV